MPCTGMRVSPKGEESPVAGIWGLQDGKGRRSAKSFEWRKGRVCGTNASGRCCTVWRIDKLVGPQNNSGKKETYELGCTGRSLLC